MTSTTFCCAIAACLLGATPAAAQELPLWELGALGFAANTPAYPGSSDRSARALVLPYFIYRGKVLRADQDGVGVRLFRSDRVELDVGLAGSLPASSDEDGVRAGMPDLGSLVEFGPRIKIKLYRPTATSRVQLELPLRAVLELRGGARSQGYTFEPRLAYEIREARGRWTVDANVSLVLGERKINGYFYDVDPAFANATRPAYRAEAGLMMIRAGLSGSRLITPDLRLFGFIRYDNYANAANRDSPLMQRTLGSSAGVGFAWTIRRSAQPAK